MAAAQLFHQQRRVAVDGTAVDQLKNPLLFSHSPKAAMGTNTAPAICSLILKPEGVSLGLGVDGLLFLDLAMAWGGGDGLMGAQRCSISSLAG
jgi:hypothetical protein